MVKTIVVTGAGGFVGSALVPLLLSSQSELLIRAQIRHAPVSEVLSNDPRLQIFQGDLNDPGFCQLLCEGADHIIHLAGFAHTTGSQAQQLQLNLQMTQTLASAAVAAKMPGFTYLSSIKAQQPEQSAYAQVKLRQEQLLLALHQQGQLRVTCLRPTLIYGAAMKGNLKTLLRVLSRRFLPLFPNPGGTLGLISREDCCHAIIASLNCTALAGACWQLDDGHAYRLTDLLARVRAAQGLALPKLWLPKWSVLLAVQLLAVLAPLTGKALGRGSVHTLYDQSFTTDAQFQELTGWHPTKNFYEALPHLLESLTS